MIHNFRHSVRNVWRNKMRTIIVLIIVGIAVSLVLTMTTVDAGIKNQVKTLEAGVGTGIGIRPAGTFGGFGRGGMLDESLLEGIKDIPHIVSLERSFVSMIAFSAPSSDPASGFRQQRGLTVTGVEPGKDLELFGGGNAEIVLGRNFEPQDNGQAVMIVGESLSEVNEWAVGETVYLADAPFEIVGIAGSANRFGAAVMFMPLATAQFFTGQEGVVSQARVIVDRLENVDAVVAALNNALGEEADVVAEKDMLLAPVESILNTIESVTRTGVLLALATAGIVIFAVMILIVRERTREIGILKAIGASRSDIAQLFTMEALTLVGLSLVIGTAFFVIGNEYIIGRLLSASMPATGSARTIENIMREGRGMAGGFGGSGFAGAGRFGQMGMTALLGNMEVSLEWKTLATSFAGVIGTGFIGSLLPAAYAARLKPTEVLRSE
ncbi:MAG: ABC transporter permease [Dethiobacter sp.]|nr:ABC transporter permease [Dethiobacter sp.]